MTAEVKSHVVLPIAPCVGDSVEMHLVVAVPAGAKIEKTSSIVVRGILDAKESSGEGEYFAGDYTVLQARVDSVSEGVCNIIVRFTPWNVGSIQLGTLCVDEGSATPILIVPPSVDVASVFPNGAFGEELRPPLGPLLPPYTVHTLYISAAMGIVLLAAVCMLLAKRHSIHAWMALRMMEVREWRNLKSLRHKLSVLGESRGDDTEFCSALQEAVKTYLGKRFGEDFRAYTTREVSAVCFSRIDGVASSEAEEVYDVMIEAMRRTDYVRFAKSALEAGERGMLLEAVADAAEHINA